MFPLLLVPLAVALGFAAHGNAAPVEHVPADSVRAVRADAPVSIEFRNDASDLATLYAVPMSGIAVRLGEVMPGSSRTLTIPRAVVASPTEVNFVAVPFARHFVTRSGPVSVAPGQAYELSLSATENSLSVLPGR